MTVHTRKGKSRQGETNGQEDVEEGEEDSTDQDVVLQRHALEIHSAARGDRYFLFAFQRGAVLLAAHFIRCFYTFAKKED